MIEQPMIPTRFFSIFFEEYPQFKGRDLWITGESYGGHYVPEAVQRILHGNEQGNPVIHVKGFMAGNPWTFMPIDNIGAVNTWWTRALVPKAATDDILFLCDLSNVGPLLHPESSWSATDACDDVIYKVQGIFSGIDIYDIYVDVYMAQRDELHLRQYAKFGSKLHAQFLPREEITKKNVTWIHV